MAGWNGGMPGLVDGPGIPPPPGAVRGGQPELHGAFPGYQQGYRQQQPPAPNWFQTAAVQGTPWANAGAGASWANTPAPASAPGPSWANTPAQGGWQQQNPYQQQAQTPGWPPQMPQQGWGAAHQQGTPTHWGAGPTPWDDWNEPPPLSAPASLSHGFSATAAPPIESSSSGQPITSSSWFAQGARGPTHGMPGGMGMYNGGMMDDDSDDDEWEKEEGWAEARAQRHAQQHRDPRAGWGQGHTPPAGWPQAPGPAHGHDPRSGWPGTPVAGWPPQDPTPAWAAHELTRTHSQGGYGYPKSPKKKKRSNSFGGGQLPGWGATPHTFDEQHLSRRPDDWREGYSPRGASGADLSFSSLFRVGRRSSESGDLMDTRKRTLTDVLTFNAQRPNILFDVRRPPEATSSFGSFRPRNDRDLMVPALMPAAARMRLMHPRLPWYIDVKRRQPNSASVTLYDVLRTLYEELDRPIASRDFYNEELGKRDRDNLTSAFKERCAMNGKEFEKEEMLKGVKRVDFLGMDCVFLGLVKRNGMWEIKTGDH